MAKKDVDIYIAAGLPTPEIPTVARKSTGEEVLQKDKPKSDPGPSPDYLREGLETPKIGNR